MFFHLFPCVSTLSIIHYTYELSIYCHFPPLKLPTWVFEFCLIQDTAMADRFDCDNCKESLYGRKYIQSDDSPYCIPCYDSLFSNTCDECKELIGHDARVRGILTWSDTQLTRLEHYLWWHVFILSPHPVQYYIFKKSCSEFSILWQYTNTNKTSSEVQIPEQVIGCDAPWARRPIPNCPPGAERGCSSAWLVCAPTVCV